MFMILGAVGCRVQSPVSLNNDLYKPEPSDSADQIFTIAAEERAYRASRTRLMDLLHTKLEVRFDWETQRLIGKALLQFKPYFYPQDKLLLDAKNFDIHTVKLINGTEAKDLKYYYDNLQLMISLDRTYTRQQDIFVEIQYTAKPTEREIGGSEAIESDQGLYFINHDGSDPYKPMQIWTQGETEASSYWFPTIDSPNERCTQEMYITVNEKYKTLSNGELIYSIFNQDSTRTDYWKMDLPHAPYLFMMAVGEFAEFKDTWNDIPVTYLAEEAYGPYLKDIFGKTPEMINYFSDILDYPFPWPKYSQVIVRDYVSGAMENTTASIFYEELLSDRRDLIDYDHEAIIAHELMHQWFGDLVTTESWSNLTLNEGFANYAEYLWQEYAYGDYEADLHNLEELEQYLAESEIKQEDLIRFHYDDREDMFDSHSYAKGGRILHMLRNYVGDDAFFTALNLYLKKHQFSSVEVHDLRLAFEEITGEDLNWFFNQWFLASGHPVIDVSESYADGKLRIEVIQRQDLRQTPLYKLPVNIEVWIDGTSELFHIVLDKQVQVFEFDVNDKPELVLFDSDQVLLAEVFHPKSRQQYLGQFLMTDKFLARFQALDSLMTRPGDSLFLVAFKAALNDDFWYFRQMAINAFEDFDGEGRDDIIGKLAVMAREDSNPHVRADALHTVYMEKGDKLSSLYQACLTDSSYMVAGTALYALSEVAPEVLDKSLNSFEASNNINIVIPLANYYINKGGFGKYDWFEDKIQRVDGETLWYLLQYFGEYIMMAEESMQRAGVSILEKFARSHQSGMVRLGAYQSLGLLVDLSGVDAIRKDIIKNEKSEYLRQLFESMP
jgi:aminopeptidase N